MKKLVVISFLTLIVMFPSTVFALNVYSTPVHADFVNQSWKINPLGTADITYDVSVSKWTVKLNITGLMKNHSDYLFQFAVADQITVRYDYDLNPTDRKGNLTQEFSIYKLDSVFVPGVEYWPETEIEGFREGYTVVRIIDKCGVSGGKSIKQNDPNPPSDLPYLKKGTVVIRAREDDKTLFIKLP